MIVNGDSPYDMALSGYYAAYLRIYMRGYQQAESLAERILQLSEKNQFPQFAAISQCILGHARAQVGRAGEGIELIRQGIGLTQDRNAQRHRILYGVSGGSLGVRKRHRRRA
jgi:hypothetical protein